MINGDEINQYLEAQKEILSDEEFLNLLFKMLAENPSKEMLWLLRADLLTYSLVDRNRVANYLARFLSDPDPLDREVIVQELFLLALSPKDDAYKILHEFLGEEPTEENRNWILSERLRRLREGKQ